ncbi:MAG: NAD(P)-dependent oxidoreductase [Planctomycetota bacterium]
MSDARPIVVWYPEPPDSAPGAADALQWLLANLPANVQLHCGKEGQRPDGYQVLIAGRLEAEWLAAPSLETVIIPWAGIAESARELLVSQFASLAVHNLHHNAAATAETAVALMLAAARRLLPADRRLREGDWTPRFDTRGSVQLSGGTAVVLGYGAIGRRVARVCTALDMTVHATRRQATDVTTGPDGVREYPPDALHDLLPIANALIISLPLTPATKGLIGERELTLMRRDAVLVNVGRAHIVDESALFHALRDGVIGAAGLDVWYRYPEAGDDAARVNTPPSAHPFGDLDNVVMSPHRAGWSLTTDHDRMRELRRLLDAMATGRPVPHRLDLDVGY